jgi:uncharacterized protein
MSIRFTWDQNKADRNRQKHGIAFEEAATVFRDPTAVVFDDDVHSDDEYRELLIGHSNRQRVLIVSFVERGDSVHIISARKADSDEKETYQEIHR